MKIAFRLIGEEGGGKKGRKKGKKDRQHTQTCVHRSRQSTCTWHRPNDSHLVSRQSQIEIGEDGKALGFGISI